VQGATAVGLVILLYEQAIEDLRKAAAALEAGRVEERTQAINHALAVIAYLESSLNFEQGGTCARVLERFYHLMRSRLCLAQREQSPSLLRELMEQLMLVRGAWIEADRGADTLAGSGGQAAATGAQPVTAPGRGWKV
jgi:flagellar protein FliS